MMVSEKSTTEGHKYRHELVNKILETDIQVDIYGRGCIYYSYLNDPRVKGKFDGKEPYENYSFHICIENCKTPHYFSEKIIDALICDTTPVYWGCQNIDSYFPNNIIRLTGDVKTDIETLRDIHKNPEIYRTNIDVEYVKNTVSLLKNIKTLYA
jgi:hypothetical protein